ncbi:ABC transporter permease [Pyramidobacter piscolens]|uniref:ABC transporter, permease protein n=1 Tax=Pyramidobacter piscolens W5455 TaxID=352165 RepID=A0ABM9ZW10_9BACT|nr:ABC transporter permease [Pyramidobacter piscolens]EFB91099.1 ABC transporter, permease protein [Pyramidobacter piscolens W5455]BDF78045.1 peptide ABC transporter permease [Pyramidobacter piscolens]
MTEKISAEARPVRLPDLNDASLFEFVGAEEKNKAEFIRPSQTYWQDAWQRLKRDKLAMFGLFLIVGIFLMAIFGPLLSPYAYDEQDFLISNEFPSWAHPFGTDMFGRDMFVRVMYGARISLAVGLMASLINLTIGVIYGSISGFVGGRTDDVMMRIVDTIRSVPTMIYVILLMVVVGPGLKSIFITLGINYWTNMARIVRAEIMRVKNEEFVLAARVIGASPARMLLRHLIPNAMGPILVTLTFCIPQAIFAEAFLSFVGLGVSAPMASWGVLSSDAMNALMVYPYQLFFPAMAISLTILAFNFFGDGLRDALDPRLRK